MSREASKFPDTYRQFDNERLIEIFAAAPERISRAVEGLSVYEMQAQPLAGKWSIQQIVAHLADAEIMGAARIRQTFAEPGAQFAVYDQDRWASEFDYQNFDHKTFYSYLMLFDSLRLATCKIFQKARDTDWQKAGSHPDWGPLTLRQLLELYADHGERHLAQILERRKLLGKLMDLPLLLQERLY